MSELTYRMLPESEWERVRPIFQGMGGDLPPVGHAHIFVGEDENGEIIATGAMEAILHAGYLWVQPEHRGHFRWQGLRAAFERTFEMPPGSHYSIFTTNEQSEAVAKRIGAERLPIKVWQKEV